MTPPSKGTVRNRLATINSALVGTPGGRSRIDTPALILDLDVFERNIAEMASYCQDRGIALRPHGKTHKCPEIAKRQVAAGAIGLCCAKVSEVELFAEHEIDSILLTAPLADRVKADRLAAARNKLRDLFMVVDHLDNLDICASIVRATGKPVNVLVDIDVGLHRTGVTSIVHAVQLAQRAASMPGLMLSGIQGYAGHLQHISDYAERERLALAVHGELAAVRDAFIAAGLKCDVVSGSGTGTFDIDASANIFTELQAGSYVFMDAHYQEVREGFCTGPSFAPSLFVATQVVSNCQPGFVTTDAGSKSMALDGAAPWVMRGITKGAEYRTFGDQFGRAILSGEADGLALGARLEVITPHCDPTVNLYDVLHCARGDIVESLWEVGGGAVS